MVDEYKTIRAPQSLLSDDIMVDVSTGEIVRWPHENSPLRIKYGKMYCIPYKFKKPKRVNLKDFYKSFRIPYKWDRINIAPVKHDKKFMYAVVSSEAKSLTQLEHSMEWIDTRKVVSDNNVRAMMDAACGASERGEGIKKISKQQYTILNNLCNSLTWCNFIHTTTKHLAEILGCLPKHIKRKLNVVKNFIRYEKVNKSEWRVFVHPAYGWKYISDKFNKSRSEAINDWCKWHPADDNRDYSGVCQKKVGATFSYESLYHDIDDLEYELEFRKKRDDPWPKVAAPDLSFLPSHLQ